MFCSSCGSQASGRFCASCGSQIVSPQENIATQQPVANFTPPPRLEEFQQFPQQASPPAVPGDRTGIFHLISKLSLLGLALGFFHEAFEIFLVAGRDTSIAERAEILFEFRFWETFSAATFALTALAFGLASVAAWVRWVASGVMFGVYFSLVLPLSNLSNGFTSEYLPEQPIQVLIDNIDVLDDIFLGDNGLLWFFSWILSRLLLQLAPFAATLAMLGATVQAKRLS